MNRIALGAVVLAVMSSRAVAADLPSPVTPPVFVPPPVFSFPWTGVYVGVNVGYGGGNDFYNYRVAPETQPVLVGGSQQRSNGVLGGGQVGFNYALGPVVLGAETDFDGTSIASRGIIDSLVPTGTTVTVQSKVNYFGTVRGRLGYVFDRVMVYGTGGFAYANVTTSTSAPAIDLLSASSHTHIGYAVGGGVEFAVTHNLTLRAEYLRLDCQDKTFIVNTDPNLSYRSAERPILNVVRVGLNYRFDLFAPAPTVVARY